MAKREERETLTGHMAPVEITPDHVRRLVRQSVERVADDDTPLRIALLNAALEEIPVEAGPLTGFILAQLRSAVAEFAGEDAAARMLRSLKPLLKMKTEQDLPAGGEEHDIEDPPSGEIYATVIVCDADVGVRSRIVQWLRTARYNAVSAPSANVALAMCVRTRPDLIIADADAADVSGQKLSALLNVAFGAKTPPLLVTEKPLEQQALLDAVAALLIQ